MATQHLSTQSRKVLQLQPVSFEWNEKTDRKGDPDIGLIAEDVLRVFPDMVWKYNDGRVGGVYYHKLPKRLQQVLNEQSLAINELSIRVDSVEKVLNK
jgi:hypothetical protein